MMPVLVQPQHRGFTLIESIISILVVAVMFVASMSVLSQSRLGRMIDADGMQGQLLAEALMSEILLQAYQEPVDDFSSLGLDTGEVAGDRSAWDDVDDYEGWAASPPQDKNGVALPGLSGWTRSVEASYVKPNNLDIRIVGANTGVKIIVVVVRHNGRQVAKLYSIRTGAAETLGDRFGEIKLAVN